MGQAYDRFPLFVPTGPAGGVTITQRGSDDYDQGGVPLRFSSLLSCFLFMVVLLSGCRASYQNMTSATLVGTYVFRSDASHWTPLHRIGERLSLHGDGTYVLESGEGNASMVSSGSWVFRDGDPPTVYLDHAGYPIEFGSKGVRLIVNNDVDARYEKNEISNER